ncbi:MAG: MBL fold metallo-hydrolase [Clostridia bacterium]|nr:MBL fold metallo-hydrolase [Clostridia bacterium]
MARLIQICTAASLYDGPFDSVHGWSAAGMGYLIVTDGGRLIMIDGGFDEDAEALISLMKETTGQEKPTVDLWIVTHPHGDHYYALRRIAAEEALRKQITVKELIFRFPAEFRSASGGSCEWDRRQLENAAAAFGATVKDPKTDEHIGLDGLDIHFLYTPDDLSILHDANQLSLIFTVTGAHKKLMITGDAHHRNMQIVVWRYRRVLKCDVLQLPHHGLCDTGNLEFYKLADAKEVLVPISVAGHRSMHSDMYELEARRANLFAEENADRVYLAFEGNTEIEI